MIRTPPQKKKKKKRRKVKDIECVWVGETQTRASRWMNSKTLYKRTLQNLSKKPNRAENFAAHRTEF